MKTENTAENKQQQLLSNLVIVISLLLIISSTACSKISQEDLQQVNNRLQDREIISDNYEMLIKSGDEFFANQDFQKAEQSFREALKIAENKKWINEVVAAKERIATTYMAKKEFEKSELMYYEAISDCEGSNECSVDQLDVVLGFLSHFYLYSMKDISKFNDLIKTAKQSKIFAKAGVTKEKICRYIIKMYGAGYVKEATELANEESCGKI